jgi:hypothetical protein
MHLQNLGCETPREEDAMYIRKIYQIIAGCLFVLAFTGCFLSPTNTKKESENPQVSTASVDSMFIVLVKRVQTMDTIQSYDGFAASDFTSLKTGFAAAVAKSPNDVKANVGLMVSSLMSLNKSRRVENLADSLDHYSGLLEETAPVSGGSTGNIILGKRLMRKAFQREGIIGLGKALAARAPSLAKAQTQKPSFPKFITLEYIQNIAEEEVKPALDTIIGAAQRLEGLSDASLALVIEDRGECDTFDLDKGEIYVADALCRLARACVGLYCTYDVSLYAPHTNDYRWIDSMQNASESDSVIISLSGDTLYTLYKYDDAAPQIQIANMFKYNLSRDGFLKIRKQNHAQVKADLIGVTDCIKNGVGYIRGEKDYQDNDIIKMTAINDADRDLADFTGDLLEAGVSPDLADRFGSPEKIAGFVKELLSGPFQFDELIDSVRIRTRVNFAAWFDDPVQDLKTLLPKYKWTSESAWKVVEKNYSSAYPTFSRDSSFTLYDYGRPVAMRIPAAFIVRSTVNSWGTTTYYLNRPVRYEATVDSTVYIDPLRLTDPDGVEISPDQIELQVKEGTFFPFFSDYTFHGLFPDLKTRQAWIAMIYQ